MDTGAPARRFYLITHPRSASNLLLRILALDDQPVVQNHRDIWRGYFFLPATSLEASNERKAQECFENLEKYAAAAEADNKIAFVKEHSSLLIEPTAKNRALFGQASADEVPWTVQVPRNYGLRLSRSPLNQTFLPDEFLGTFLIRHPALAFPSHYRITRDIMVRDTSAENVSKLEVLLTLRWTRSLYDLWSENLGKYGSNTYGDSTWPLVLEANDVMLKPEVIIQLSKLLGLDTTKLKFEWQQATDVELGQLPNDMTRRILSTLTGSSGIMVEKTSGNVSIDTEAKKWGAEFGEEISGHLERLVRAAIPDYEYLKERRLRA